MARCCPPEQGFFGCPTFEGLRPRRSRCGLRLEDQSLRLDLIGDVPERDLLRA
jgi:hypothetical protein